MKSDEPPPHPPGRACPESGIRGLWLPRLPDNTGRVGGIVNVPLGLPPTILIYEKSTTSYDKSLYEKN